MAIITFSISSAETPTIIEVLGTVLSYKTETKINSPFVSNIDFEINANSGFGELKYGDGIEKAYRIFGKPSRITFSSTGNISLGFEASTYLFFNGKGIFTGFQISSMSSPESGFYGSSEYNPKKYIFKPNGVSLGMKASEVCRKFNKEITTNSLDVFIQGNLEITTFCYPTQFDFKSKGDYSLGSISVKVIDNESKLLK